MSKCISRVAMVLLLALVATGLRAQNVSVPAKLVAYPDLIVHNAKIVSMDDHSLNSSFGRTYQAMAIRGDRIQFLGTNDEILPLAGPQTRRLDVKGRVVMPGLIDTHNHLHNGAVGWWTRSNVAKVDRIAKRFNVAGNSYNDLTRGIELVIKEQMARPEPGQWAMINLPTGGSLGTGIGIPYLLQGQMDRKKLDGLAPATPVLVQAGAGAWLMNTAARDNLLEYYEVPPTDENENLAITIGSVFDRALITDRYFDNHQEELIEVLDRQMKYQAAGGFTTYASHIVGIRFMPAFRQMVERKQMSLRLAFSHRYCQQIEPDNAGCFLRLGDWQNLGDPYYWNVGITLGGIDAGPPTICTSIEVEPKYKSQEKCILQPGSPYAKAVYVAFRSRYRYTVNHAYGDLGLDHVMDIMEQVMKDNPDITLDFMKSMRISSDHCGLYPRPSQMPRMARLGMMFSCNAMFVNRSAPWIPIYGQDKAAWVAPMNSLLKHGIMPTAEFEGLNLINGSGPTPMAFLAHFVTRRNDRGELIAPSEAIDRVSALKAATIWAGYFVMRERELGSLEAGKLADFQVLNKDYFTIPEAQLGEVYPLMTVLGGKTITLREEWARELGTQPVGAQIKFEYQTEFDAGGE